VGEIQHEERPGTGSSAEVGARVSAVLAAAEDAAEQIRTEAREEAERLVAEAEARGRARVEELTGEPERLRAEAEADAARMRSEAGAEAENLRAEAKREAEATRQAALDAARGIEADGDRRKNELWDELRAIEDDRQRALIRLQRTLSSLRGAATELEGAVETISVSIADDRAAQPRRRFGLPLRPPPPASFSREERGSDDGVYETLQETVEHVGGRAKDNGAEQDASAAPSARGKK
jgi:cell division septum initiation protein DivIVA